MDGPTAYFMGNRIWWSVSLLAGPIAAALAGDLIVGFLVSGALALSSLVIFDMGPPWWSDDLKRLPEEPNRTRAETRTLTLWSGIALVVGVAVALLYSWR